MAKVFKLEDDDDEYGSGFKGKVRSGSGDEYEEDDFDEEEEQQFKQTAVEFAKKLKALRESTNFQLVEGGEEPDRKKAPEESKRANNEGGGKSNGGQTNRKFS